MEYELVYGLPKAEVLAQMAEGYNDPTAFYGTQKIVREESETERRANELIKVLKFIIRSTGFELIERVKIRDVKTGKEFR